jgi:hypothetical protein
MEMFIGFLKYGGLGLAALVCVAVLVFQARSLHNLVRDPQITDAKITSVQPVLLKQMLYSLIGMLAIGSGALALAYFEAHQKHVCPPQKHRARITIEPSDSVEKHVANQTGLARIKIDKKVFDNADSSIELLTEPDKERYVHIDIKPYVDFRLQEAGKLGAATLPLEQSKGLSEPEL